MKAKKAIQQKMHHGSSWGSGKQCLEELFKLTFFDRFIKKMAQVEVVGEQQHGWQFFWTDSWTIQTDDYFLQADNPSHLNRWQLFFKPKDRLSHSNGYQFLVEKLFTTISNFMQHEIHGICACGAQCIKVGNEPFKTTNLEVINAELILCSSRKYLYPHPLGGQWKFRGEGWSKKRQFLKGVQSGLLSLFSEGSE